MAYGSASSAAFALVPKEETRPPAASVRPDIVLKSTVFTGPMKQNDELAKMFEKVKAGG